MNIFEINAQLRAIADGAEYDEETGEIFNEQAIMDLQIARDDKLEGIACLIKEYKAMAEAIKAEKMNLAKRQQTAENHAESLKRYLTSCLDGEKFKTAKVAISYRKSETVEFIDGFDVNQLPEQYQRRVEPEADKTALKDALKEGKEIYGVYLAEHNNTIIK